MPPPIYIWEISLLGLAGAGTGYRQQVLFTTNYEGGRLGDNMEHIEANTISWVERAGKCNHRRGRGE